jgi:hypothetical protein
MSEPRISPEQLHIVLNSSNHKLVANMALDLRDEREKNARLTAALREIAKGEGAFSRDPLTHAGNCIEYMKRLAVRALAGDSK